jgi:hypothetical protein
VSIEPDGVTLALDPSRSDLLIDAELAQVADELSAPRPSRGVGSGTDARRYQVSRGSISKAIETGITPAQISDWFVRRTGMPPSPAIKLLLRSHALPRTILKARTMFILTGPSAELIDGLLQHPATRSLLGERLGPTTVAIPDLHREPLQEVLKDLGIDMNVS